MILVIFVIAVVPIQEDLGEIAFLDEMAKM